MTIDPKHPFPFDQSAQWSASPFELGAAALEALERSTEYLSEVEKLAALGERDPDTACSALGAIEHWIGRAELAVDRAKREDPRVSTVDQEQLISQLKELVANVEEGCAQF
jgi:hypothetical protein